MKFVFLTPGTGNFHCGNCIRDNSLALALRRNGHEVLMVPLYLPMVTDRASAAEETPIFFGGINVYLQHKSALFRYTPAWFDRLLNRPGLLEAAAKRAGMTKAAELGSMTVSMLKGEHGRQRKELEKLVQFLVAQPKPDAIILSNALLLGMAGRIREALDVPVISTLQGEDAFVDSVPDPFRTQAWDLLHEQSQHIDAFVGVSDYYSNVMTQRMKLAAGHVHTIHNGIDLDGYHPASAEPKPPVLGFLARLCQAKGLGGAADAFIELKKRDRIANLRWHVAGSMTSSDQPYVEQIKAKLRSAGVWDDVEFHPNLDIEQKQAFYRAMSVLCVPAMYGEAFGLYLLEAWASGIPAVQPNHGAFEELLTLSGSGIVTDSDDPSQLADGIEKVLLEPGERQRLGNLGRQAVEGRFTIDQMAQNFAQLIGNLNIVETKGR
jgi:glycosyltransferase involved in cell wall biosynthesis